jgi:Leucine-rich repeat (LRR) protein
VEAAARRFRDLGRRCRVAADLSYVPGLVLDFEGLERVGRKFRITGAALALRARDVDRLAAVAPFLETLHVSRSLLADLKPLAALPRLRTVRVEACRKLQGTLEPLLGCKELREVDLRRAAVTGSLWPLAGLPLLKSLSLLSCWELDGSLYPLHASTNLVHVDLYSCRHVTGTLEHVAALAKLQTLKLRECHALGGTLEPLEGLLKLRHLDLSCCYEISGTLAPVARLSNLEVLNLHCCYLLRGPRNHVNGLAKLKSLNLLGCNKLTGHAIYPRAEREDDAHWGGM